MFGVDYSYGHPTPDQLKANGVKFACRYLTGGIGKKLTADEVQALTARGIALVSNYESTAGFMLSGGASEGAATARTAWAAHKALGGPDDRPIYFSLDVNATYDEYKSAREWLRGAQGAIGAQNVGIYGGLFQVQWAHEDGVAPWVWQTYAWSYGQLYNKANLYQYRNGQTLGSGVVDYDRSITADFGQWGAGDIEMPFTDDDKKFLVALRDHIEANSDHNYIMLAHHTDGRANLDDMGKTLTALSTAVQNGGLDVTALSQALIDAGLGDKVVEKIKELSFKAVS